MSRYVPRWHPRNTVKDAVNSSTRPWQALLALRISDLSEPDTKVSCRGTALAAAASIKATY